MKKIMVGIGMLRQWLNEDRITDPKKLVTNEDILHWLNLDEYKLEVREEIIKKLKKQKVICSGSCGAGCEYLIEDLIKELT